MVVATGEATVKAVAFGGGVDDEISQTWREVEERVVQMAGGDRSKVNRGMTIDNVMSYLDQTASKEKKAAEKYSTVRAIFSRTLQCIQTVGGIVANGASYVFAPAGTCYSAITFVISAWQGYEGIFDSLASLLEKCTEFLDRLSYYEAGMDAKLTRVACQHLKLFVEILDRSLKLRQKRHKFAAFMKTMFLNDDGVQDLLGSMKNLIDKERGLVAAQTWKSSNDAASYSKDGLSLTRKMHNSLLEDKNQTRRDKELEKWKRALVDALDYDRAIVDDNSQLPWEKAWKRCHANVIEGTGHWLEEDARFKAWLSDLDSSKRILALEGGDGAGKTLLASNVIMHLKKMKSVEATGSRVVVAHNFFDTDAKSTSSAADVKTVSRSVMCQLALGDEPFLKSVAGICEKSKYFESAMDMWTQLILENKDLSHIDVALFLVFDGLGEGADVFTSVFNKFADSPLLKHVRILITGTKEQFDAIHKHGSLPMEKIELGGANAQDVEAYINHRMDNMEILKDTTRPGVSEMREKILKSLQESTSGDFYKISSTLQNISNTDQVEEINAYLETAGDARLDQIEADIEKLDRTRTTKEISEINEMILWINSGKEWLSAPEMEAALALKAGSGGASLLSIEAKIKSKYTIFSLTDGVVRYKVSEIEEKIPEKKRATDDETSSSGFKEVQQSEVNIIKHYLTTICPPDLYEKFKFNEFFDQKLTRRTNYVCQDQDNGHITIALRCMACLADTRNEKTQVIQEYSQNYLLAHLIDTDLSLAERSLKAETGVMLVRLFTEEYALESLLAFHKASQTLGVDFSAEGVPFNWKIWVGDDDGVETISKWFKDSAVIEKVKNDPLIVAFNAEGAKKHEVLYKKAIEMAANQLFRAPSTSQETVQAFVFLASILKAGGSLPVADEDTGVFRPTVEILQAVEDFAMAKLEMAEKDALWEAQAASLLSFCDEELVPKSTAEQRARRALDLDPDCWSATYTLFRVAEDRKEGLERLQGLVDRLMSDSTWRENSQNNFMLANIIRDLGDAYWEDEEAQDKACATYSQILDVDRRLETLRNFVPILSQYSEKERHDDIIATLEEMLNEPADGPNNAGQFVQDRMWEDGETFRTVISKAVRSKQRFELFDTLIARALATKPEAIPLWLTRYYYGMSLSEFDGRKDAAIGIWESALATLQETHHVDWALSFTVQALVPAAMDLCKQKGCDTPEAAPYFDKIEAFARDYEALSGSADTTEASVALATYFQMRGNNDRAKKLLASRVRASLEMLSDDQVDNDCVSYWDMNQVFVVMRDMKNDLVTWEMMQESKLLEMADYERKMEFWKRKQEKLAAKTDEALNEPDEAGQTDKTEQPSGGDGSSEAASGDGSETAPSEEDEMTEEPTKPELDIVGCDGDCGNSFRYASGLWSCLTQNGSVQICTDCYAKLQEGTLASKVCSKDHEHYFLPERDAEKLATVPKGSVLVGEDIMTLEEWKDAVRAQYLEGI